MRSAAAAPGALGVVFLLLALLAQPTLAQCPSATPAPFTSLGGRVLDYLHARGEALNITVPAPVKAVYMDVRDLDWAAPDQSVVAMADGGATVILLAFYLSTAGAYDAALAWAGVAPTAQAAAIA